MLRKKIITILAVVLLAGNVLYAVQDKIFTSSGHILPGEEWNRVMIYNDSTIVNMLGGLVDQMETYDGSMLNVAGGETYSLYTRDSSIANISGSYVYGAMAWDLSVINLFDDANGVSFGSREFSILNMFGGTIEYLGALDSGTVNLCGGYITDSLSSSDSGVVNIFGYDLAKTNSGGKYGYGQVQGFWFDDTPFNIDLNGSETFSRINLIPEPSSVILLALGVLLVKRKNNVK